MTRSAELALTFAVCLCAAALATCPLAGAEPVFFNRDRSSSFPDAHPPFTFDGKTGQNILWKARLPNWCNGGLIIAGGRVFCLAEPWEGYAPRLLCFDAATGNELWRRELDAVSCFPPEQQQQVRTFARETWDWWRKMEALWSETYFLYQEHGKSFDGWTAPTELRGKWQALQAGVEKLGFDFAPFHFGAGGARAGFPYARGGEANRRVKRITELGLMWAHWRGFGTWEGIAFPTPCSDGQRVYTLTAHNHYACHDLDGKLVWQRRFPPTTAETVAPQHRDRLPQGGKWRPAWPGQGGFSTAPVLADGKLLSCAGQMLRCLDAATGDELWALPYLPNIGQAMGVPAIARVDGETLLIAVGSEGAGEWKGDEIIRIRDGKSVGFLPGAGTGKGAGNGPIVIDGDLAVTWATVERAGCTLAGYRLRWSADRARIEPKEIWRCVPPKGFNPLMRGTWCDGRAYAGQTVFDLRSGKVVASLQTTASQGYTGHGGFVVGEAFCRWNLYGGKWVRFQPKDETCAEFVFCNRSDGKLLGVGRLPVNPADGASEAQRMAEEHRLRRWRWLGASTPWAAGRRLFIRSYDFLWCIGAPQP